MIKTHEATESGASHRRYRDFLCRAFHRALAPVGGSPQFVAYPRTPSSFFDHLRHRALDFLFAAAV